MSREKQIEEKNCKECLHFEACCKWTDFPKQIGFPVCRKFTPTNTNLHQPCESVQVEEMARDLHITSDCAEFLMNSLGYRKQEWISVDERLPEIYEHCLLFLDNETMEIGWYHEVAKKFVVGGLVTLNMVTHWMPLPEAPKMKGGAE